MSAPEKLLAELCSSLEYMHDRGEFEADLKGVLTAVRYTSITEVPHFDVVYQDRVVRVFAVDAGPHVHKYQDGWCGCGLLGDEDTPSGIVVQAHKVTDVFGPMNIHDMLEEPHE